MGNLGALVVLLPCFPTGLVSSLDRAGFYEQGITDGNVYLSSFGIIIFFLLAYYKQLL